MTKLLAAIILHCPCPEHKGCAKLAADQWGQEPTGKIHTRQDLSQKELDDNTRPRYPSPVARRQHELPLFPEVILGKEEVR